MTQPIRFREESIGALSSPEQLGAKLRPVKSSTVLAIIAILIGLVAAIVGAALVHVPIMVKGPGVLISSKGVLEFTITAQHEGRIVRILVEKGETVVPGQIVASLTQPTLETDLQLARDEHRLASRELQQIQELQERLDSAIIDLHKRQENDTRESITALEERITALEERLENQKRLLDKNLLMIDRYLQTSAELSEARGRLAEKRTSLVNMALSHMEKRAQNRREKITLENRIAAANREISRLEARERREAIVRSTEAGIVSEIKVVPGDLVRFGSPIIGLTPNDDTFSGSDDDDDAHRLVASIFLSPEEGKKVHLGMRTLIEPASVRRDVYGAIIGKVISISTVPQTPEEMNRLLRNNELVAKMTENGPPFLVMVEMSQRDDTKDGFAWTSSKGPTMPLTIGTPVRAEVEVERAPIISLILPAIRELLRGPQG